MKNREKIRPTWKWSEGIVDADAEHIKIFYDKKRKPIALVAPEKEKSFIVQFLLSPNLKNKETTNILNSVRKALNFYLVDKKEENPWAYAIYHCGTGANFYSKVHWEWFPAEYKGKKGYRSRRMGKYIIKHYLGVFDERE